MQRFQFHQSDEHRSSFKQVHLPTDVTWPKLVAEFAEFLSGLYGYDIKDKIIVNIGGDYVLLRQQQLDEALNEEF